MNADAPLHRTAEVISIGDEMTSGARLDTNAQWLSQRLGQLGVVVTFHSTVGDSLQDNVEVFRIAAERADIIVSTGGLGPTRDDLTRESLATLCGQSLELKPEALEHIESLFAQRNREMPERNRIQAMFPTGSQQIFNPQGTAPGIDLAIARPGREPARIFALPGVPAEMKRMFDDTVANRINGEGVQAKVICQRVLKLFGTGESDLERRLGDMISRDRYPRVGITVSAATISLRISAIESSHESGSALVDATSQEIMQLVGEFVFGEGEDFEQHHALSDALAENQETLHTIELGCAAPLCDWFSSLNRPSVYRGGIACSDVAQLSQLLSVDPQPDIFLQAQQRLGADWLLAVNPYPAIATADPNEPIPACEVQFVVVSPSGKRYPHRTTMSGHPDILQARIAKAAMAWMRKVLSRSLD